MTLQWLEQTWSRLNQARLQERLPHALLISGRDGCGKLVLAQQLVSALLCEQPARDGHACGQCAACGWLQAGTHPDLLLLEPEEVGKAIKVDQVRTLCIELGMTSHAGRYKVALVHPADAMNVNAANSLLKTLEEPTDNTLLILISASPGRLPATIRSRCQQIQVTTPDASSARHWLQSSGIDEQDAVRCLQWASGAPLKALELANTDYRERRDQRLEQLQRVFNGQSDPVQIASEWLGETEQQTLEWWRDWLQETVRWLQAGQVPVEPEVVQKLQRIVESVDCRQLFDLLDRISNALNSLGSGLNRQLVLEDLLIYWAMLANRASRAAAGER